MKYQTAVRAASALIILGALAFTPAPASAIQILSPFGGKVTAYNPAPAACLPITTAISLATAGTITPTIEEIIVGGPRAATVGLLRIDGFTIPGLTTIYGRGMYMVPGKYVLGNSIDLCDVCNKVEDIPGLSAICDLGPLDDILSGMCDIVGTACPVTNLIYSIASS